MEHLSKFVNESLNEARESKRTEYTDYSEELENMISKLDLEIESVCDDHDEVMVSAMYDYAIKCIKEKMTKENFDEWDNNYVHEIVREVLDEVKENKDLVIKNAKNLLFSNECRILDSLFIELEETRHKYTKYVSERKAKSAQKDEELGFTDTDQPEIMDEEETQMKSSIEGIQVKLKKNYYDKDYRTLFDKHYKGLSGKIKKSL